jgi:LemA protein
MEPNTTTSKKSKWVIWVVIVVIIAVYLVGGYNSFVTLNEKVNNSWAQIDSQLQRRYDLIPNLVGAVKGATQQEKDIFLKLAEARTRYSGATTPDARASAANEVEQGLGRLLAIFENYPQLRSVETFTNLMSSLEGTENRVAIARKDYNDSVNALNTRVKGFPSNLVAKIFGFSARTYFEIPDVAKANPKVDFTQ